MVEMEALDARQPTIPSIPRSEVDDLQGTERKYGGNHDLCGKLHLRLPENDGWQDCAGKIRGDGARGRRVRQAQHGADWGALPTAFEDDALVPVRLDGAAKKQDAGEGRDERGDCQAEQDVDGDAQLGHGGGDPQRGEADGCFDQTQSCDVQHHPYHEVLHRLHHHDLVEVCVPRAEAAQGTDAGKSDIDNVDDLRESAEASVAVKTSDQVFLTRPPTIKPSSRLKHLPRSRMNVLKPTTIRDTMPPTTDTTNRLRPVPSSRST